MQREVALCLIRGEQEGIGVDGCRQIVRGLLGVLGMHEGEFSEGEEMVAAQVYSSPPQCRQGGLQVVLKLLCQAGAD